MSWSSRPEQYPVGQYQPGGYSPAPRPRARMSVPGAAVLILGLLALMWALEIFDQSIGGQLDYYGIHARELDGLPGIATAPFLHGGFGHLIGNSMPFLVLGFIAAIAGFARWLAASTISVITSGLFAWLLTPANTVIIGASGLIMGWLTYVIARGIFDRKPGQIAVGVAVLLFYGGMIWGVLPTEAGVSWQAHLGGAVGGVLAARWLHGRQQRRIAA